MSINAVSPLPRYVEPNLVTIDPRLQANEGEENSCWSTAMKIAGVIAATIASIGSCVLFGPLVGVVITLLVGTVGLLIFNSCCGRSHDHRDGAPNAIDTPWYQRVFSFIPTAGAYTPQHVGRRDPHVPVGGGHIAPAQAQPWDWFSFIPSGFREMNRHVPVGGGHGRGGAHVPVGRGHTPNSDVHDHTHGRGGYQGPTSAPPPTGPSGHVPVGRGHRN